MCHSTTLAAYFNTIMTTRWHYCLKNTCFKKRSHFSLLLIYYYISCIIPRKHSKTKWADRLQRSGTLPFSVTITSVCELPYLWMWSTASYMLSTTSMQHSRSPYSVRSDFTSDGLKVRYDANLGPACIFTCIQQIIKEEITMTFK